MKDSRKRGEKEQWMIRSASSRVRKSVRRRSEIEGETILITGGAGFIGTAIAEALIKKNRVILYDNLKRNSLRFTNLAESENLSLIKGDVLDRKGVDKAIKDATMVIHLAAIAGVDTVLRMGVETMRVNIIGTYNLLEASVQQGKIKRFIDFSTSEVFGTYAYKVQEGDVTTLGAVGEARWTYAVSKLATEHMAINYFKEYNLPALSIRPFNIYGPRQTGEGAIHHFIVRALKGEELIIHNDGSQIRAWCYIDDIVRGVLSALKNDNAPGHAFNMGNPRSVITIYNLATLIKKLCKSESKIRFVRWNYPDVELRIPDIEKARRILRWEPKIDLEEGLIKTIEWYRRA